ncbi:hypothetical protein MW887_007600 [Aspergillus wentii]|nr:hypothetical protein MW887_007600 [Aspergillus wentii]
MRQKMSEELTDSAEPDQLNHLLMLVDEECQEPEEDTRASFTTLRGPFGAFRLIPEQHGPVENEMPVESSPCPPPPIDSELHMDLEDVFNGDPLMESLFWDVNAAVDLHANNFFSATLSHAQDYSDDVFGLPSSIGRETFISSPEVPSSVTPLQNLAPKDAPFLLSYYKNTVITMFSPVSNKKTIWHIIHLSSAMNSLAQMTMGEWPGNAPLCTLYAILATSAFALRISAPYGSYKYWQQKAEGYTMQAQTYLKLALQDASAMVKKVKYKDLLIALLCMHTVSVYQGSQERIRSCLLDCESWIHSHGLPKTTKSRKVRLLHHCYVYLRIFHESTSVSPITASDTDADQTTPATMVSVTTNRSFRLRQWEGRLDQRMNELKDQSQGENDLHLELPGRWDPTMYPIIYGIPESFFFLLSQVTRLANEKDLSESGSSSSTLTIKQFSTRARSLENYIRTWKSPPLPTVDSVADLETQKLKQANQELIQHMLCAFHKALLIFFYRRIYDMDAAMLQDKVRQVQDELVQCDRTGDPAVRHAATFAWIAFIAGCEALDPTLQDWFYAWFEASSQRTGLGTFELASQIAHQVWERQRQPTHGMSANWPDLVREKNLTLFYA